MILVLNNKSNYDSSSFEEYLNKLELFNNNNNLILCPSFCYLGMTRNSKIDIGAQDVSSTSSLAMTGDVTARQLKSLNVKYCIVGHADRSESSEEVKEKIHRLFEYDIVPILCVGENNRDSSSEEILKLCIQRLDFVLAELSLENRKKVIISYEPKWAISGDIDLDIEKLNDILKSIKSSYPDNRLLYGGGVSASNYSKFDFNVIDGFLLGRIGNDVDKLVNIN